MKNFITKKDIIIICAVLILGIVGIVVLNNGEDGKTATIKVDGDAVETVLLDSDYEKTVNGVSIVVQNGEIFVEDSTCSDKVCSRSGRISKSGESIICAPNRVSIEIDGENGDLPDAVVG